tara:strand:- start:2198 stop:2575 length:378 start_codon:yes stop_codon:yes gene_type:complete
MQLQLLKQFDEQLTHFFDELIRQFPHEGDLVIIRLFLTTQISAEDKMRIFTETINSDNNLFRNKIKERDEIFFLKNDIFDRFGTEKSGHFKKLWASGQLDKDDKEVMFKWLDIFVKLSDRYNITN